MKNRFCILLLLLVLCSCAARKVKYDPSKKYSPKQLLEDYSLFRKILEESHPSLYWYTPKDSVNYYFEAGAAQLKDSLPEYKFHLILSTVLSHLRCGHTTVRASEAATRYADIYRTIMFPLGLKIWNDTAVITSNVSKTDSMIGRGMVLRSIEGRPISNIADSLFQFISADGYNTTHKYQTLSNPGAFRIMYGSAFGLKPKMQIGILDANGTERNVSISIYNPAKDTLHLQQAVRVLTKKERKEIVRSSNRNMRIDSSLNTAFMEVNTFTKNNDLRGFFRRSFRRLRRQKVENLVIDVRGNGGGSVVLSNLLTRYIADKPFKIADSLYALKRKSSYGKYQENYALNRLFLLFMTHKKKDGHYHFSLYENKYFKPKLRNHFNGQVYLLTGGNTFSAAVLFTKALSHQANVTTVGEETGGGAYGNTAWLIPDVTLPNTKLRFRLPLFRLVIDRNAQKGRGVIPQVYVGPTVEAIRRNVDYKMEKVEQMIRERSAGNKE